MNHSLRNAVAALGALLIVAPGALAGSVNCAAAPYFGVITGSVIHPVTINGDLVVPDNTSCSLVGTGATGNPLAHVGTVTGNVTVGQNASLHVGSGDWIIGGNLQASNCNYVSLNPGGGHSTTIFGNVQIGNCSGKSSESGGLPLGTAFGSFGPSSTISGDFQCHNNTGSCILHPIPDGVGSAPTVGGNVQVMNNVSPAPSQIYGVIIVKTLQCQNNIPVPTGGGNTVLGNPNQSSEGQCEGF